ncbi:MAG: hypothetical protein LBU57_00055 [Dysgonamonadaceae bacterium]|jgi:hypothetical protein|nr:hypothetical protein [Dysgonamonadaceae bacterium]
MKGGQLLGGIALGAIVGVGIGYLLGVDSEKRNQWFRMISAKVLGQCDNEECDCNKDSEPEATKV